MVYAGARARGEAVSSIGFYGTQIREEMTSEGLLVAEGPSLRLIQDYLYNSPSPAAMTFLGRSVNGRIEWKTAEGQTLRTSKRLNPKAALVVPELDANRVRKCAADRTPAEYLDEMRPEVDETPRSLTIVDFVRRGAI